MSQGIVVTCDLEQFTKLLIKNGWHLAELNDEGAFLSYGVSIKGHGDFVYNLAIKSPIFRVNKMYRTFDGCFLIGPQCKATGSVQEQHVVLHEWKTFRGASAGVIAAFMRELRSFKYMVSRYGFK